jgi:hypothetical protein
MAVWNPYVGSEALFLAVALFVIGFFLIFYATKLKRAIKIPRVGGPLGVLVMVCWVLCLVFLLATFFSIPTIFRLISRMTLQNVAQFGSIITGPVSPITVSSAIFTFVVISFLCRTRGLKAALASAFVGTAVAPMIFELPYLLMVMGTVKPTLLVIIHFYLPLLLATISTISLLLLSNATGLSNYALFSLGGMFIAFAVWALIGFPYPSDPLSLSLNGISKLLSFATAIMLFLKPTT